MTFKTSRYLLSRKCSRLSSSERLVALYLVDCRNSKTGACFPKQSTIASDLSISEQWVKMAVNGLVSKGELVVVRLDRKKQNHYFLACEITHFHAKCEQNGIMYRELKEALKLLPEALILRGENTF